MQAAQMGGQPWMMSFSGMGEVLGWPARLSLVADSDRPRILAGWTQDCRGHTPRQRYVPFAAVRHLQPEEFVAMLAEDLQVSMTGPKILAQPAHCVQSKVPGA